MRKRCANTGGFILLWLIAILFPVAWGNSYIPATTENDLRALDAAIELFEIEVKRIPSANEGLAALGSYTRGQYLKDGWGNPYVYVLPGPGSNRFGIYSLGKDGASKSGGNDPDDINTWNDSRPWRD